MPFYSITVDDVVTPSTADQFKTVIGIKIGSAGVRGRVVALDVGAADDTLDNLNLGLKIAKTNNAGDGTGTSFTPKKVDNDGPASSVTAAYVDYSAEPTTYDTDPFWITGMHSRANISKGWGPLEAFRWKNGNTLGVLICTRTNTSPIRVSLTLTWEEY